jgi:putative membrane protein
MIATATMRVPTKLPRESERRKSALIPVACLTIFIVIWTALAWSPVDRATWLLENSPTFVIVPALVLSFRRFQFSNRAYVQGLVFLVLHTIGSHYSYSLVPLGETVRSVLELSRNHYDRFVHLAFGVLLYAPTRELAFHRARAVPVFAQLALSFTAIAAFALGYELVEWGVAVLADPAAGISFLGTQGDEWDAQKDMALACSGALLAVPWELWRLRKEER